MTYFDIENQYTPEEKELFVSYKRRNAAGEIVHNWGSYTSKAIFKRDWHWFKQQIIGCEVIDMKTKHSWFWNPVTGWTQI